MIARCGSVAAVLVVAVLLASPGAAQIPERFSNVVGGEVLFSGPPPAGAILQVFLFDLTDATFPEIIADLAINNPLGSPIPFRIQFDPRRIDARRAYAIQARIIFGNPPQVAYITGRSYYVLTQGHPSTVSVRLEPTGSAPPGPGPVIVQVGGRNRVTGNVSFRMDPLPSGAILQVFLFDLTDPTYPLIVVDKAINDPQESPVPFELRFDPQRIDPQHVYGLQARIIHGKPPVVVLISRPRTIYVLTRGNPNHAELVLRRPR
ncbi:MAG: YbaY family lipoprotein [Armatimonadota bacterium]